ncbi:MAG TPA: AmmeMemoRadiSam system protein A [Anaerolineales bacterium]|nr:AmmeMemoRadiSam system protein A [Anaerolineales bacterium]
MKDISIAPKRGGGAENKFAFLMGVTMIAHTERQFLLTLARHALVMYLESGQMPHVQTDNPALLEPRAVFVTLRVRANGDLRGCRGETQARHPLIESVALMSVASATDDPRFSSVRAEEVPGLHIEINALTPLAPIRPEAVEIGRHGLMIARGAYAGLLLPEVATRYGWDAETFLKAVCRKAGLRDNAWKASDAKLYGFEAEVWGEDE